MSEHRVRVSNGKYTFIVSPRLITILRSGQPWHQQAEAVTALHSIMCELDAARVIVEAARQLGDDAPASIKAALMKHRVLVDDTEHPSEWTR